MGAPLGKLTAEHVRNRVVVRADVFSASKPASDGGARVSPPLLGYPPILSNEVEERDFQRFVPIQQHRESSAGSDYQG